MSARTWIPGESDTLRTRIAAVLYGYVDPSHRYDLADAVIAELDAIKPISYGPGENRYRYCCPKCGDFWFDHSGLMQRFALSHGRSHVTDRNADDE